MPNCSTSACAVWLMMNKAPIADTLMTINTPAATNNTERLMGLPYRWPLLDGCGGLAASDDGGCVPPPAGAAAAAPGLPLPSAGSG